MKCITRCYINLAETLRNAGGGKALVICLVIDFRLFSGGFSVGFLLVSLVWVFQLFPLVCFSLCVVMEAVAPVRLSRWGASGAGPSEPWVFAGGDTIEAVNDGKQTS